MQFNKKNIGWLTFTLIIIACYKDLTSPYTTKPSTAHDSLYLYYEQSPQSFQVISYQFQRGDQLLSIIEQLSAEPLTNIDQVLEDFQSLNPKADVYQLAEGRVYLLPVYSARQINLDL
ncbi:hypothetical protein SAMN04488134_101346 [Amphibacillus marinus]|uniref:LysM domain-containing protein n=1 Tax=Amphibacillus marinus TaxID=872970 RepID=A0A1H8HGY3_9BACI|nr:hypothetical protein [Amphibacillus marinus]SEN55406.1 hypothetical protein SAMN04488134_101346 [Amphibacillus marinus]